MSNQPEKLCVFCEQLQWEDSRGMGSTWTGPYGTSGFSCKRGHFNEYGVGSVDDISDVRKLFLRALTCPDFDPPKEAIFPNQD